MKIRLIPKRKLRAATAVRRMPRGAMEDYAQEPNMSFGRAIVVVVVLHLVAVAGICAFSSLKARNTGLQQGLAPHPVKETGAEPAAGGDMTPKTGSRAAAQEVQSGAGASAAPVVTPVKQPAGTISAEQSIKPPMNETVPAVKDSGALYTVAKGDTPMSIAKKLHVSYDDLLKLNKITDPKKLKIGQKLRVPVKKKTVPQT